MEIEERLRRLEENNIALRHELSKAYERIEQLEAENRKLMEEILHLKEENQKLRLAIYGIKPSKKRSEDPDKPAGESKPKKRGPPFGHEGAARERPESVNKVLLHKLSSCPECGGKLKTLKYYREKYTEDIVPAKLFVTKHLIKHSYCPACDKIVYPEVPETIGSRRFGISFLLYVTYLRFVLNLPYNKMAKLLNDAYKAGVGGGTLVNYVKKAAELFGSEYERIKREMRYREMNCHYDDTGQRVDCENRWLWVFINKEAALYHTSKNRGKKVVVEILGEDYDGVTVQDFYPSYDRAPGKKQRDWAHLLKDARELAEKRKPPPGAKELYEGLQRIYHDAKGAAKGLRTAAKRKEAYRLFVRRLKKLAEREYEHFEVKRLAKRVLKYRSEMFTFILVPGVEPTNNIAERALRQCVVQRKISGCHRTQKGAEDRDILMSVIETTRLQGEDFFEAGKEYILNTMT